MDFQKNMPYFELCFSLKHKELLFLKNKNSICNETLNEN